MVDRLPLPYDSVWKNAGAGHLRIHCSDKVYTTHIIMRLQTIAAPHCIFLLCGKHAYRCYIIVKQLR